jgi:hypothetical protein
MHKNYVKAEHRFSLRWPADVQRKIFVKVEDVQKERQFFPTDALWRVLFVLNTSKTTVHYRRLWGTLM